MEELTTVDPYEITLEKLKIAAREVITREATRDLKIYVNPDPIIDRLVVQVTERVWTEKLDPIVIKYPETWIDAFKVRFLKGWRAKYHVHTIDLYRSFPEFHYKGLGAMVRFAIPREEIENTP